MAQRPAAPWSNHNFWGQYDAAVDLPNSKAANAQNPDIQTGDMAWAIAEQSLYVCTDSTLSDAVWVAIGGGSVLSVFDNQTRPDADTVSAGTAIFNTSDNAPNFSDGTNWRDASGNIT